MFQGSPFKQDRIEKHLARQRGAGVRNLTTSFGFSFGLQPATVVQRDDEEPPAKRRKSAHPREEKAVTDTFARSERVAKPQGHRMARQTATKREQPRRFEVPSDEDKLETVTARSSGEQDDGFVVAKESMAKRGRPTKTLSATPDGDTEQRTVEVQETREATAKKRGRPKKATCTVQRTRAAGVMVSGDAIKQPTKPTKKRGRPRKALAATDTEPLAVPTSLTPQSTGPARSATEGLEPKDLVRLEPSVELLVAAEKPKPSIKKRGRPRKAQVEDDEPHAEVEPCSGSLTSVDGTKRLPEARDARRGCHETEQIVAQPTRRPRRQAAAAAMSKVSKGFIEEEAPIDKKRRDPEPPVGRGRKKLAAPALSNNVSSSGTQGDVDPPMDTEETARNPRDSVNAVELSTHELPPQPSVPTGAAEKRRQRTKPRAKVLPDSVSDKPEILPDAATKRRLGITKRVPLSETPINIDMPTPSPERPGRGIKAARNGTQMALEDVGYPLKTTRDTRDAQAVVKAPVLAKSGLKIVEKEAQGEESTLQRPGCYSEAFMPHKGRNAHKHAGPATWAASPSELTGKPATSRRNPAATSEHDKLDWLFEKSTKRQPPAAKKHPVSKRRVYKDEENTAEMDLDDLLSNIASFVPNSLRA